MLIFYLGLFLCCSVKQGRHKSEVRPETPREIVVRLGRIQQLESGAFVLRGKDGSDIHLVHHRTIPDLSSFIDMDVRVSGQDRVTETRREFFLHQIVVRDYLFVSDLAIDADTQTNISPDKNGRLEQSIHIYGRYDKLSVLTPHHDPKTGRAYLAVPKFIDVDFDGDLDILLQRSVDEHTNVFYDAWRTSFAPKQDPAFHFRPFDEYSQIINPEPVPKERAIVSIAKEGSHLRTKTFRMFNGRLELFSELVERPDSNPELTVRVKDEMVALSPSVEITYSQMLETVQKAYESHFLSSRWTDYPGERSIDGTITGLDEEGVKQRISELENSGLFSSQYIKRYQNDLNSIDLALQNRDIVWKEGSKAPLVHSGHPWCRCQDYPDSYWKWMALHNLKILSKDPDKIRVGAVWSFDLDPAEQNYDVELVLHNGTWIIDSLQ